MAQYVGTVAWFDLSEGYVFLSAPGMKDVFCYRSSFQGDGYKVLIEGETVEFDLEQGLEGSQAVNVKRLG